MDYSKKKYLTREEQKRVLRKVRALEQAARADRVLYQRANKLGWLCSIPYNVRAGYLFCEDVSRLARLLEQYEIETRDRRLPSPIPVRAR
jgi:hypothetical protein